MSFANMLGGLLQQGLSGQTGNRMQAAVRDAQSGGLEQVLAALGGGGQAGGGGGADLAAMAQRFLTQPQAGGMSGGQLGGLGALAGALLGGGGGAVRGALGGSALAVLGTLAVKALANAQNRSAPAAPPEPEVAALMSDETAGLLLRGMVAAAQADGTIDRDEMGRIMGEAGKDGVTEEERQLVMQAMTETPDPMALALAVPSKTVAAQLYAASLLAITVDTDAERTYLRQLASALGLDAATVQALHAALDAPAA